MNHPGPIHLIYGSESPIKLADVSRHLSSARKRRRPIEHLSFMGCQFHEGARAVFRKLGRKLHRGAVDSSTRTTTTTATMKELAISGIAGLGNEELISLAPFLNTNRTLRSLDLTGATFTSDAIHELRPFFSLNTSLEVLALGENPCIGDEGVHVLVASLLQSSGSVQVLAMDSCGIGIDGVASISSFMCHHHPGGGTLSLRVLELSRNYIGDYGAQILADAILRGQHRLGQLYLNYAEIGDDGALAFGRLLLSNQSLITLSLQNNTRITDLGASGLLESLFGSQSIKSIIDSNHTLKSMHLMGCSLISPRLLQRTAWYSLHHGRHLATKDASIRWKVEYHINNADCGLSLENFDLELLPHMLALFGKFSAGMTSIYHAMKCMPQLYSMYEPQRIKCVDESSTKSSCEPDMESAIPFWYPFKMSSSDRSMRKYYAICINRIPMYRSMCRHRNNCTRINREPNKSNVASQASVYVNTLPIINNSTCMSFK